MTKSARNENRSLVLRDCFPFPGLGLGHQEGKSFLWCLWNPAEAGATASELLRHWPQLATTAGSFLGLSSSCLESLTSFFWVQDDLTKQTWIENLRQNTAAQSWQVVDNEMASQRSWASTPKAPASHNNKMKLEPKEWGGGRVTGTVSFLKKAWHHLVKNQRNRERQQAYPSIWQQPLSKMCDRSDVDRTVCDERGQSLEIVSLCQPLSNKDT